MSAVRLIAPQHELDIIPFKQKAHSKSAGLWILILGSRLDSRFLRFNVPLLV